MGFSVGVGIALVDIVATIHRESHRYLLHECFSSRLEFPLLQGGFNVIPKEGMRHRNVCRLDGPVCSDLKLGSRFPLHTCLAGPPWEGGSDKFRDVKRGRLTWSLCPNRREKKNTKNYSCHFNTSIPRPVLNPDRRADKSDRRPNLVLQKPLIRKV